MAKKELPKPKKNDRDWQKKIANNLEKEKIKLNHPKGMERFQKTVKRSVRKKLD